MTHPIVLADLKCKDTRHYVRSGLSGPVNDVHHRAADSHRKISPLSLIPNEAHTVALEK